MTLVRTFPDVLPLEREDSIPWTEVEIAEAPDVAGAPGAWTTLETQALSPADTDPANPALRTITTALATQDPGWYRLRWLDAHSGVSSWTPAISTATFSDDVRPTVTEVAGLLRARTKLPRTAGREAGTFTSETRPTADQVDELVAQAADEVLGKIADPETAEVDDRAAYKRRVKGAITLYAAVLVELSYFPEQISNGQSPQAAYKALYDSRMKALIAEGETGRPSGTGDGDAPADAAWWFPEDQGGLVGWGTAW